MPPVTKPRWVLVPGIWWLDAVVSGVSKPALEVAEVIPGSFEVHVVRGAQSARFVVWRNSYYTANNTPDAKRAIADEIWSFVTANYEIVAEGSVAYNGLIVYNTEWPDRGQLGID